MIGTIIGDILGSPYESQMATDGHDVDLFNEKCRFTDDTVMTVATMDAILNDVPYHVKYKEWARKYPKAGYGTMMIGWFNNDMLVINQSYGNGSAMRVSPIAQWTEDPVKLKAETIRSTKYTHENKEAEDGALAINYSIHMAKQGCTKKVIQAFLENEFGWNLNYTLDEWKTTIEKFTCRCSVTVPQALICFLQSKDYEDCIRNAIYLGGDTDTVAAMSGGIAQEFYKNIPYDLIEFAYSKLTPDLISVIIDFNKKCINQSITTPSKR